MMTGSDMTAGAGAAGGAGSSAGGGGSDAGGGTAQGRAPAGSAATNGDGSPSSSASSGGSLGGSASNGASPGASSGASPNTAQPHEDALTSDQIQVTLVSPKGDPQPAISFTLTLPSGAVKAGATSADGALRFSGLTESGTCKLVLDGIPSDPAATSAASRVRYVPDGVSVPIGKASVVEVPPHAYRGRLVQQRAGVHLAGGVVGTSQVILS